jgi:hypothetical protein
MRLYDCAELRFSRIPRMSPPAQNTPPAPVRITARTFSSSRISDTSSAISRRIGMSRALRASGRFRVTMATSSRNS